MKMVRYKLLLTIMFLIFNCTCMVSAKISQQKRTYIVHMDKTAMPTSFDDHLQWYDSSLRTASGSASMLYTYNSIIHGYSTRLTSKEAEALKKQAEILSVQEELIYELHTTRTPEFLGLGKSETLFPDSNSGSEVIVGVLDTGVWPELKSFDDTGLGPVPSTWKGECEVGKTFSLSSCNRKLIGARFFAKGYEAAFGPIDENIESKSPRDDDGHGSHTATTAAGSAVTRASLFGYAEGTARGMAPRARVAAYKVCWVGGCLASDIIAGMEKAIEDGVNILSMSIGGLVTDYWRDAVAIGAFTAMSQGIFVSCSAGNGGPISQSVSNVAPWITTVGAGTLDREFPAYVILENGKNLSGVSLYSGKPLSDSMVPLVYAANTSNTSNGNLCMPGSLEPAKVAGKIVLCDRGMNSRVQKGLVVKNSGGIGMILTNTDLYGEELVADAHLLPAVAVGQTTGDEIKKYIHSSGHNQMCTFVFEGTHLGVQPSPVVAAFSSRGPNPVTPAIIKPDLIAPGVNILAGWTGKVGPTGLEEDTRHVNFNIISGTSMSCPHVSGLAALLKAAHPEWSPAAIKSALMTTAYTAYKNGKTIQDVATGMPSTPFDHGAGHVEPTSAVDPGLVYDATVDDYVGFFCALNYTVNDIKGITKRDVTCDPERKYNVGDLNYPSFAVSLETASGKGGGSTAPTTVKYTRTLTNVGNPATYKVSVSSETTSVKISVEPGMLTFRAPKEKKSYTVTFIASSMPSGTTSFARLQWSDEKHIVYSPIAFSWT